VKSALDGVCELLAVRPADLPLVSERRPAAFAAAILSSVSSLRPTVDHYASRDGKIVFMSDECRIAKVTERIWLAWYVTEGHNDGDGNR
jgi:hypothetical protein